jgi:hypothetical protein
VYIRGTHNGYNVHPEQKLGTACSRGRCAQLKQKKMKQSIISIILIIFSITTKAEYESTFLPSLIEESERIAHIKITKDLGEIFEAEILNNLKGNYKSQKIRIQKFEDWTCAERWSKYSVGQEEIVFLIEHKTDNYWIIMGAGNEGEMPIEKESIYYKSPFYSSKYFKADKNYKVQSGNINATEFDLSIAIDGIKLYLSKKDEIEEMISNKKIIDFYSENTFFQRAINEKILMSEETFSSSEIKRRKFLRKEK